MARVTTTCPPETSCRQTVWGCYLKTEELSTLAPLSDCLIWSFLQCPSDIKKRKKLHSVNAEQIKGNVPLTLPHWGLETVKISAQLLCTDLPGKIIFLDWCGILSWRICSYRNFIASGLGTAKFTASHFSSRSTGCEAGNTGNATKSQFPLGTWLAVFVSIFLTALHPFLYSQVKSCGLMRGSTEAVQNGAMGPLRVTLVSGVCLRSEPPLLEMAFGPREDVGDWAYISPTHCQQPLISDGVRRRMAQHCGNREIHHSSLR